MQFRSFVVLVTLLFAVAFLGSAEPVKAKSSDDSSKTTSSSKSIKSKKNTKSAKSKKTNIGKININKADVETLTQIKGIGPKTAASIVAYRKKNGKFKNAEDLLNVKGIGPKTLKGLKSHIRFK